MMMRLITDLLLCGSADKYVQQFCPL